MVGIGEDILDSAVYGGQRGNSQYYSNNNQSLAEQRIQQVLPEYGGHALGKDHYGLFFF